MKKVIIVISLMIIALLLRALTQQIMIEDDQINLKFENVKVRNLEFYEADEIQVEYTDASVTIYREGNNFHVASTGRARIDVFLPESKTYFLTKNGAHCTFDKNELFINTGQGESIRLKNRELTVYDKNENEVVIVNSEGVFAESKNEKISIGREGIYVEGEESKNLSGFWGKLLGGFVRFVVNSSMSVIGDSPAKLVKQIINDNDGFFKIDWELHNDFSEKEIQKNFIPATGDKIDLSNLNGSVSIGVWDQDSVDILAVVKSWAGEEHLKQVEIEITKSSEWLIETKHRKDYPEVSVDYEIKVPNFVELRNIDTSNGSVKIEQVKGDLKINSSNGQMTIHDVVGTIEANNSNGSIEISNISGRTSLNTSNGRIELKNIPFLVQAVTSNSSIRAELDDPQEDLLISSSNGGIDIYLTDKSSVEINATTSNADVKVHSLRMPSAQIGKAKLNGVVGKGGPKLTVNTSNAVINFYNLQ